VLWCLAIAGFAYCFSSSLIEPVPYSLDEPAHLGYVQSLATGQGIPVVGRSTIPPDILELAKASPVGLARGIALKPDPRNPAWGIQAQQYEGYQGPLYYATMIPFYWIGHPFGVITMVWVIRLATILEALLVVPLIYLASRELFPEQPAAWLVAPGLMVCLGVFYGHSGYVSNDGIMAPLGALCIWTFARACRRPTAGRGVLLGLTIAGTFLGKSSGLALVPLLTLGTAAVLISGRRRFRSFLPALSGAVAALVVCLAPWLAFNEVEYHALSGARAVSRVLAGQVPSVPFDRAGVKKLLDTAGRTLFPAQQELAGRKTLSYSLIWAIAASVAFVGGTVTALVRKRRRDALVLIWLALSMPLGVVLLVVLVFEDAGGGATPILGRHLLVLAPIVCIVTAYGVTSLVGRRVAVFAAVAVVVAAGITDQSAEARFTFLVYETPTFGSSPPVYEQSYSDEQIEVSSLRVRPSCPATEVGALASGSLPRATINGQVVPEVAFGAWTEWVLPSPHRSPFVIRFNRPLILGADSRRSGVGQPVSPGSPRTVATSDPAAQISCPVTDPAAVRFHELYPSGHPLPMNNRLARDLPWIDLAIVVAAFAAMARVISFSPRPLDRAESTGPEGVQATRRQS
jgi:hypothetical protein